MKALHDLLVTMLTGLLLMMVCLPKAFARKWTDSTGKYTVEAEFVELQAGNVRLRKPDGAVVTVLLGRLSQADQQWVQQRAARPSNEPNPNVPTTQPAEPQAATPSPEASVSAQTDHEAPASSGAWKIAAERTGQFGPVTGLAFSPDGKTLVSASAGRYGVNVWETATWYATASFDGPKKGRFPSVPSIAFAPDSGTFAINLSWLSSNCPASNKVRLFSTVKSRELAALQHAGWVHGIAFSPDGKTLAACDFGITAPQWENKRKELLAAGKTSTDLGLWEFPHEHVKLWDTATWQVRLALERPGGLRSVAFSPDGTAIAVGGLMGGGQQGSLLRILDPITGQVGSHLPDPHGGVGAIVFSPDGALLANDGGGFTVQVAELATGTIRGRLEFYEGLTRFVDPSEVPLPYPPNHILNVVTFAFSPDSKRLAIGTGGWRHPPGTNLSDLALYEIPQWECDRRLTPLLGDVTVWTADAPRVFKTLSGFNRIMSSVQFSPRGDTLLAVGHRGRPKSRDNYDRVLNLWDPATGQVKAALNHEHDIRCASFSPDGKLLAVGGGEQGSGRDELGKLTIWTLATR